jgi:hypothetical protein
MATLGSIRNRARVDKLLVNVSQEQPSEGGFICEDVLTRIQVVQETGLIGSTDNDHLRIEADLVGGETPYPQYRSTVKQADRYVLEKHGLKSIITEEDFANEEAPWDARRDRTRQVTGKLRRSKEFALAAQLTDTAVLTNNTTLSGTDQYNDYSSSDPIGDFKTARLSVYDGAGVDLRMPGGKAIVPWNVRETLRFHTALIDNIKQVVDASKGISDMQLADVLGVNKILVPFARYNTSKRGQADSLAPIWGKHIVFMWSPDVGTKEMITLGFQPRRRNDVRVFRNRMDDPPNAEKILVDHEYDLLLTQVDAAYLIKDAIA